MTINDTLKGKDCLKTNTFPLEFEIDNLIDLPHGRLFMLVPFISSIQYTKILDGFLSSSILEKQIEFSDSSDSLPCILKISIFKRDSKQIIKIERYFLLNQVLEHWKLLASDSLSPLSSNQISHILMGSISPIPLQSLWKRILTRLYDGITRNRKIIPPPQRIVCNGSINLANGNNSSIGEDSGNELLLLHHIGLAFVQRVNTFDMELERTLIFGDGKNLSIPSPNPIKLTNGRHVNIFTTFISIKWSRYKILIALDSEFRHVISSMAFIAPTTFIESFHATENYLIIPISSLRFKTDKFLRDYMNNPHILNGLSDHVYFSNEDSLFYLVDRHTNSLVCVYRMKSMLFGVALAYESNDGIELIISSYKDLMLSIAYNRNRNACLFRAKLNNIKIESARFLGAAGQMNSFANATITLMIINNLESPIANCITKKMGNGNEDLKEISIYGLKHPKSSKGGIIGMLIRCHYILPPRNYDRDRDSGYDRDQDYRGDNKITEKWIKNETILSMPTIITTGKNQTFLLLIGYDRLTRTSILYILTEDLKERVKLLLPTFLPNNWIQGVWIENPFL